MRVLPSDAYAALRHPFVRSFAIGRFAAIVGWQMINVAVGWLLYERTGDPWSLGLVGVAELTPVLFLMVVAGIRFLKAQSYRQRPSLGLVIGGIPAVLIAAFIVERMNLLYVRWLVVVVVLYTAIAMLRSVFKERNATAAG